MTIPANSRHKQRSGGTRTDIGQGGFINQLALKTLITGGSGAIGHYLCRQFCRRFEVYSLDRCRKTDCCKANWTFLDMDLSTPADLESLFLNHSFDTVIHCAGLSSQKGLRPDPEEYRRLNVTVTRDLALQAALSNPAVHFIFLSTVSVYGDPPGTTPVTEDSACCPSGEYAASKLEAENELKKLADDQVLHKLDILRLSPVYDRDYTANLDKRVFLPGKLAYVSIGPGRQKMSALSRKNLYDFIGFLLEKPVMKPDNRFCRVYNVSDPAPYAFSDIIRIFKQSDDQPDRIKICLPSWMILHGVMLAGRLLFFKKHWLRSVYMKLSLDFIYDNTKMLQTGFRPEYNLEQVFLAGKDKPETS